jgi:hypothetical protein
VLLIKVFESDEASCLFSSVDDRGIAVAKVVVKRLMRNVKVRYVNNMAGVEIWRCLVQGQLATEISFALLGG